MVMSADSTRVETFELVSGTATVLTPSASLDEASFQLPRGAYTTLRTYGRRRILRLDQHVRRLEVSAALQGRAGRIEAEGVRQAMAQILAARRGESKLRLTFAPPRLFASVEPFEPLPPQLYEDGVRCATVAVQRDDPHGKDTAFLATARSVRESLPEGVHEGLLLDREGRILEGLSSNFFAVLGGVLRTEGDRVLKGVTRSLVLELAAGVVPIDEQAVAAADLPHLSEAFITSVSREILPVAGVDGIELGAECPGPITVRLMAGLQDLIAREAVAV